MKYALAALAEIDQRVIAAERLLIASDFDGTLCPIASSPAEVHVSAGMAEILRQIAACTRMTLAVISGRALKDVARRVPKSAVVAGNHGLEISGPGVAFHHPDAEAVRPLLDRACAELEAALQRFPGAWVERKGLSATVHYRAVELRAHGAVRLATRAVLAPYGKQFALRAGNRALEVRPSTGWEKGSALDYILSCLGPFDGVVAIGDDRTDETMFFDRPAQINVKVGGARPTSAGYHLNDPAEVAIFLGHLLDMCRHPEVQTALSA
jgi:trehalose 6-phosphate phosphatase